MAATNIQRLDSNLPRDIRKEKGGPTIRRIPLHAIREQGLDRTSRNFGVTHESLLTELKLLGGGKIGAQKNTKQNPIQFEREDNRRFEANAPLISRRSVYPQRPTLIKHTMKYIIDR